MNIKGEIIGRDDLNWEWPKKLLLTDLEIPSTVKNTILRWYKHEQDKMTLIELFDLVISNETDPREGYLISPLLELRYIRKSGFLGTVNSISKIRFGNRCNGAWELKYSRFLNAHRVKGELIHSWSFPITEKGKSIAKFRSGTEWEHRPRKK